MAATDKKPGEMGPYIPPAEQSETEPETETENNKKQDAKEGYK